MVKEKSNLELELDRMKEIYADGTYKFRKCLACSMLSIKVWDEQASVPEQIYDLKETHGLSYMAQAHIYVDYIKNIHESHKGKVKEWNKKIAEQVKEIAEEKNERTK